MKIELRHPTPTQCEAQLVEDKAVSLLSWRSGGTWGKKGNKGLTTPRHR